MKDIHEGEILSLQCDFCNLSFSSPNSLAMHKENLHNENVNQRFQCTICKKFKSQRGDAMKEHIETHKEKWYTCKKCDLKFFSKQEIEIHRMKCMISIFNCNFCNKESVSKDALRVHTLLNH